MTAVRFCPSCGAARLEGARFCGGRGADLEAGRTATGVRGGEEPSSRPRRRAGAAWGTVHDALALMPGWAVEPCTFHGEVALWHVAAIDLRPRGRYAKRESIKATGATEIEALGALVALLEAR